MRFSRLLAGAGLLVALALIAPRAAAQDAAPSYPADIRAGGCANPGEAVASLTPLVVPEGDSQGSDGATPAAQSVTDIALLVPDLLGATHAVTVYASPEQAASPIVCGEIGGVVGEDGSLSIGLQATNGAKLSGTASFAPTRKADGTTVTLYLVDERRNREPTDGAVDGADDGVDVAAGDDGGGREGRGGAGAADGEGNTEVPAGSDETLGLDDVARLNPNVADLTGVDPQTGAGGGVNHPGRPDIGGIGRERRGKGGDNGPARAGEDGSASS